MSDKKSIVDMTLKERFVSEKAKMKEMTWKERCAYFWEYYKIIPAAIVIIIVIIVSAISIYKNNQKEDVIYVSIINSTIPDGDDSELMKGYEEYIEYDEENQSVVFDTSMSINLQGEDTNSYNSVMKFVAVVAASEMDVMISESDILEHYASQDTLMDLETLLPAELYDRLQDYLVMSSSEDGVERVYGIRIEEIAAVKNSIIYPTEPTVLSVIVNSQRTDAVIEFIEYLFQGIE